MLLHSPHTCCRVLNVQVLWKTYGRELLLAGVFKLMWSVFVILGGELHSHTQPRQLAGAPAPHMHLARTAVLLRGQPASGSAQRWAPEPAHWAILLRASSLAAGPPIPCLTPALRLPPCACSLLLHSFHPAVHPYPGGPPDLCVR